jgi:hypothetical protein
MRFDRAILAALVLLQGCRQLVGVKDRQVFDGGAAATVVPACGLPTRGAACAACMTQNCCALATACVDDTPCRRTEECVQPCATGDSACALACSKQWDPVSAAQAQLQDCRDSVCADACLPWDCLDNVSWQIPASIPDAITVRANAKCNQCGPTGGAAASAGVHVRVCSIADPDCRVELASGDTDENGTVTLTFDPQKTPAPVFLEFHKDGWLDDLLMLNTPPLSYDFDVGVVHMDQRIEADRIAADLGASYDPSLALVKLSVSNCNLRPDTGIQLAWDNPGGAAIAPSFNLSEWDAIAVNLPVPPNRTIRVVARKTPAESQDGGTAPVIATANLVVRAGAITLAPFVTPTP